MTSPRLEAHPAPPCSVAECDRGLRGNPRRAESLRSVQGRASGASRGSSPSPSRTVAIGSAASRAGFAADIGTSPSRRPTRGASHETRSGPTQASRRSSSSAPATFARAPRARGDRSLCRMRLTLGNAAPRRQRRLPVLRRARRHRARRRRLALQPPGTRVRALGASADGDRRLRRADRHATSQPRVVSCCAGDAALA